ncbi:MAG: hypothetical protein JNJ63_03025 [Hyphomonadaceae bacterium]|nr:hypothetical protein [Hyphomonadaceae bacterium]
MAMLAIAAPFSGQLELYISRQDQLLVSYITFAFAGVTPVVFSWRRAISNGQLPARNGAEPRYEHVSGWSAILLAVIVVIIAALVWWAAGSNAANRKIHAEWGTWVVVGLSAAFVLVAAAPVLPRVARSLGLESSLATVAALFNKPAEWVGQALSAVDGVLVFAVANAAGTNRKHVFLRYAILASVIATCATLGYFWPAPWAFVPIAWGFLVAFSVSRRWAWIEQDRELAMLNPTLSQAHIRVGFAQNLRDEALLVFLSMFLLVPLALRQAQLLANDAHVDLFSIPNAADVHDLGMWISFYGTELAKAVPFVDWAEVYHVEGDAPIQANHPLALHAVFATRVLIDLVFLAALLQAISAASRDAQQRDLFYRKKAIRRLDPFTEPDAFRLLVRRDPNGEWERNTERFDEFPAYDQNRLVELSASRDERIRRAADFLLERDGVDHDPHHRLSKKAAESSVQPDDISILLDEVENTGPARNIYQLALTRRRLVPRRAMLDVRRRIVRMISVTDDPIQRTERTERLLEALIGEHREPYAQARRVALDALAPDTGINLRIRQAIEQVAAHDGAQAMRNRASEILRLHPETA